MLQVKYHCSVPPLQHSHTPFGSQLIRLSLLVVDFLGSQFVPWNIVQEYIATPLIYMDEWCKDIRIFDSVNVSLP